jgi:hypothetical protein
MRNSVLSFLAYGCGRVLRLRDYETGDIIEFDSTEASEEALSDITEFGSTEASEAHFEVNIEECVFERALHIWQKEEWHNHTSKASKSSFLSRSLTLHA